MLTSLQYNKGSLFDIDFTQRAWSKLEDLFNEQPDHLFQIDGLFINTKSKYGDRPFVAFDKVYLADLPQHMLDVVKDMIADPEVVEEINEGKVGFTVRAYMSKTYNRECYSIRFEEFK